MNFETNFLKGTIGCFNNLAIEFGLSHNYKMAAEINKHGQTELRWLFSYLEITLQT